MKNEWKIEIKIAGGKMTYKVIAPSAFTMQKTGDAYYIRGAATWEQFVEAKKQLDRLTAPTTTVAAKIARGGR